MLLDFNGYFIALNGEELKEEKPINQALAIFLSGQVKEIPAIKAYDWATSLYKQGKIEIDNADYDLLMKVVEQSNFGNLGKAQIINLMKASKLNEKSV